MPRRREVPKREITPDPKYRSETVAKFISVVMKSGKKSAAEKIVYGAMNTMAERSKKDPIEMFTQALGNVRPLVTTWPVLTESCFFLNAKGKSNLLTWVRRGGLRLHPADERDLPVLQGLIDKYGDRMDFADASLVWLGAKLKISDIVTIDRDDFSVYRAATGKPFRNLFPPL